LPINHTNKTRIQAYGCSYTAGVELFDHLIDANADLIKHDKGYVYWANYCDNTVSLALRERVGQLERANAWPAIVAQHYAVGCSNKARGGASLAESLLDFEQDLFKNPHHVNNTLFVFGITNNTRILKFNREKAPYSLILTLPKHWRDPRLDPYTALELWDDTALTWQHLQLIQRLLAVADRAGAAVLLFDMMGFLRDQSWWRGKENIAPYMLDLFDHVWNQITSDPRVCLEQSLQRQRPLSLHGGGHPKKSMHKTFSQYVIDCIDSKVQ